MALELGRSHGSHAHVTDIIRGWGHVHWAAVTPSAQCRQYPLSCILLCAQAFLMGHSPAVGLKLRDLRSLTIECTDPYPVFARHVMGK